MTINEYKRGKQLKVMRETLIDLIVEGGALPPLRQLRASLNRRQVTEREMESMFEYYVLLKNISEIAEEQGVVPSVVYRNIIRGVRKLVKVQEDLDRYQSLVQQENLSCDPRGY